MKNKKLSSLLVIGGIVAGALGSIGLAVHAQNSPVPQTTLAPVVSTQASDTDNIQDKGGVEVVDQPGENDGEQNDAVEQATLAVKVKITSDQAKAIALAKVPGTVSEIELGDENGTPVYDVSIGTQELKVNAIDGSIVKVEQSDGDHGSQEGAE